MRVAVTASAGRLAGLETRLAAAGHDAVRAPLVRTAPIADRAAATALLGLGWRLYPSRSAVEAWTALGLGFDDGARIGAVGPGTAGALRHAGADVTVVASRATGENLAHDVLRHPDGPRAGDTVGVVQGNRARDALAAGLRQAGVRVRSATVYASQGLGWSLEGGVDAVVLASPSAVAALPPEIGARALLLAIGPTTAAAAVRRGWAVVQAAEPTVDGVVDALLRCRCGAPTQPARAGGDA